MYSEKMEDAKWNISKLDDLQCIVCDDFLAVCDLLSLGPEIVTTYPMWTTFWIDIVRHQMGKNQSFVNEFGWLRKPLKQNQKCGSKTIFKNLFLKSQDVNFFVNFIFRSTLQCSLVDHSMAKRLTCTRP